MILIIGGHASGKREYVQNTLGYSDDEIAVSKLDSKPALVNLHDLIKKNGVSEGMLESLILKEVITCNEVGCGVIPIDKDDRDYRESVGRMCTDLAKHAKKVIRIYAGIPTIIKEEC